MTFTGRLENIINRANTISRDLWLEYLAIDHVLMAMIEERVNVPSQVMLDLSIAVNIEIVLRSTLVKAPEPIVSTGKLPKTPRLKAAIEGAEVWAKQCRHSYVGPEHLFLAMLDDTTCVLHAAIEASGSTAEAVRHRCLQFIGQERIQDGPKAGGPVSLSLIAPVLLAVVDGLWVRLVDGKLEFRDQNDKELESR